MLTAKNIEIKLLPHQTEFSFLFGNYFDVNYDEKKMYFNLFPDIDVKEIMGISVKGNYDVEELSLELEYTLPTHTSLIHVSLFYKDDSAEFGYDVQRFDYSPSPVENAMLEEKIEEYVKEKRQKSPEECFAAIDDWFNTPKKDLPIEDYRGDYYPRPHQRVPGLLMEDFM